MAREPPKLCRNKRILLGSLKLTFMADNWWAPTILILKKFTFWTPYPHQWHSCYYLQDSSSSLSSSSSSSSSKASYWSSTREAWDDWGQLFHAFWFDDQVFCFGQNHRCSVFHTFWHLIIIPNIINVNILSFHIEMILHTRELGAVLMRVPKKSWLVEFNSMICQPTRMSWDMGTLQHLFIHFQKASLPWYIFQGLSENLKSGSISIVT